MAVRPRILSVVQHEQFWLFSPRYSPDVKKVAVSWNRPKGGFGSFSLMILYRLITNISQYHEESSAPESSMDSSRMVPTG